MVSSQPLPRSHPPRITAGTRLGSFEILALLGRGGMGEVYHARDLRLEREVALKVLASSELESPEALARFEREARLVAALNHPNIASLYGLHETDELLCLIFELVPGRTLRDLLAQGPLALDKALRLARQIADALCAAGERGIVHRDLKPSNVMVTPEGSVKVLDFGLAQGPLAGLGTGPASLPTVSMPSARLGMLAGTPWYMSPEQFRGQPTDGQSDLWAFGCLLFEMLAGTRAFEAATLSDTIAAVLEREPDWSRLPPETPGRVRGLIERCLRKERRRRLHHAGDARLEIDEALAEAASRPARGALGRGKAFPPLRQVWLGVAGLLLSAGALGLALGRSWSERPLARLQIDLAPTAPLALDRRPALALAPDGRRLVYAGTRAGAPQLYVRPLDQLQALPIPGTEGGDSPVFSPDGESLAFAAEGKLKVVRLTGGTPRVLAPAPALQGLAWGSDGRLYFAPSNADGVLSVAAGGGEVRAVTALDAGQGERAHRWPCPLPGGRALLFVVQRAGGEAPEPSRVEVLSLASGERRPLLDDAGFPTYVPTGHLLFTRGGRVLAARFDAARLELRGPAVPIAEEVSVSPLSGAAHFTVASDGLLVYAPGGPQAVARSLLWVTLDGSTRPVSEARHAYFAPRLSPDGRRVALAIEDEKGFDLWIQDLERGALTRLTADPGNELLPVWGGRSRLVYGSASAGHPSRLFARLADGSGEARPLLARGAAQVPGSVSPDGRFLAFTERDPTPGGSGEDLWVLPLTPAGTPTPFLRTPFDESGPAFSPDGRWLAFVSNETGRAEVYVRPFPGPGGKWQISTEGGEEARWAPDGGRIFFRNARRMLSAAVHVGGGFRTDKPQLLFEDVYDRGVAGYANYDVLGREPRLLMIKSEPRPVPTRLDVVQGWFAELRRLDSAAPRSP